MKKELNLIWDKLESWYLTFVDMLPNLILALVIGVLVFFLARGAKIVTRKYILAKWSNEELKLIFSKVVQFVFLAVGFLFALSVINMDKTVTSILAGVGVIGLALGFAFQDIAANFISGLFMASNKPFSIGDIIEVNGITGTVTALKLRTTEIKTFQGNDVIIPNTDLFQNPVTNYTSTSERRIDLEVGVAYDSDLALVKQIAIEAVNRVETVKKDKGVEVLYMEFGGSSINFEVRFWISNGLTAHLLQTQSDAIQEIKKAFDANDISIPFPITTLDLSEAKEEIQMLSAS
jgi:small conductance mechanosensitive channel